MQPGDSVATTAPVPTDAQGESNTYCGKWYFVSSYLRQHPKKTTFYSRIFLAHDFYTGKVQEGDDCSRISIQFGVSVHDFFFLNPHLDKDCSNLWKDTSYCMKPVGNIETYTGYPISVPSTTFTRPPPATSYIPVPVPTPPLNPKAPGTIEDCYSYENAFDEGTPSLTDKDPNSCSIWAPDNITVKDLVSWNPSLTEENCIFIPGYSYCLRRWETEREYITSSHEPGPPPANDANNFRQLRPLHFRMSIVSLLIRLLYRLRQSSPRIADVISSYIEQKPLPSPHYCKTS